MVYVSNHEGPLTATHLGPYLHSSEAEEVCTMSWPAPVASSDGRVVLAELQPRAEVLPKVTLCLQQRRGPGPCRTEFSDVGFDFIVVGTNKIKFLMNSIVHNLNYLAFAPTGA